MQTVFLVEDSAEVLKRLIALVEVVPNARVVGHAARADEAVRAILAARPDVVILDLKLAQGTGFDVLLELHGKTPDTAYYMLSNFAAEPYRRQAERLGARGFFDKSTDIERLRSTLQKKGESQPCQPSSH